MLNKPDDKNNLDKEKRTWRLKYTKEKINNIIAPRLLYMPGEYTGIEAHTQIICLAKDCGHIWHPVLTGLIHRNGGCPKCLENSYKVYEEKWLKDTNIGLKEEFINMYTSITHYCKNKNCGMEWKISPNDMKRRIRRTEDKMMCCCECRRKVFKEFKKENKKRRSREYAKERKINDLAYRIVCNIRSRICTIFKEWGIKKSNSDHTFDIISCSGKFYANHILSQYKPDWKYEMVENDHHIPISHFNILDKEQRRRAFHWSNVKPMLKEENNKKKDKLPEDYNYLYFDDSEDKWITIYWGA